MNICKVYTAVYRGNVIRDIQYKKDKRYNK